MENKVFDQEKIKQKQQITKELLEIYDKMIFLSEKEKQLKDKLLTD